MDITEPPTSAAPVTFRSTTAGPQTTLPPPDTGTPLFTESLPPGSANKELAAIANVNTQKANELLLNPTDAGERIPQPPVGTSYASGTVTTATVETSQNIAGIILSSLANPDTKSIIISSITETYSTGGTIKLDPTVAVALYAQLSVQSQTALPKLTTAPTISFCWPDTNNVFPILPFGPCLFATVSGSGKIYTFKDGSPDTIDCKDLDGTEYWNKGDSIKQNVIVGKEFSTSKDVKTVFVKGIIGANNIVELKCFLEDAPVLTPTGYRTIGTLKVGDLVTTATGKDVAIQSIHIDTVVPSKTNNPYIIPKGLFGAIADLPISPYHKVAVDGNMIAACNLGLDRKKMTTPFNYYNLELPNYETMIVGGVMVESLIPITRITVTREEFADILRRTYGDSMTKRDIHSVLQKIRHLADGGIEVPVDKRIIR